MLIRESAVIEFFSKIAFFPDIFFVFLYKIFGASFFWHLIMILILSVFILVIF